MPFQPLFKNIFDKNESDAGSASFLQQVIKQHPSFSLAHFFLLKQTAPKHADYPKIAAKTALHFNNSFLLHSQLHKQMATIPAEIVDDAMVARLAPVPETTHIEIPHTTSDTQLPREDIAVSDAEGNVTALQAEAVEPDLAESSAPAIPGDVEDSTAVAAAETSGVEAQAAIPVSLNKPTLGAAMPSVDGTMLFTPLYATDYFASQGIKLREEALPNDKLGKQLEKLYRLVEDHEESA